MANLLAHAGTRRTDEAVVMAVQEPEFTKSWHPISHAKVIEEVRGAVKNIGLEVRSKDYSLSVNGDNMFGVWTLDKDENGKAWSIGIRNSLAKMFAVGICAGLHIFVCDNLAFAGDFVEFRKHTSRLDQEVLRAIAEKAMGKITKRLQAFTDWHNSLSNFALEPTTFKALTFHAMENKVFPPSKFESFIEAWKIENQIAQDLKMVPESLYTFHSAGTRVMRESSLFQVSKRNDALTKTIDGQIEASKLSQNIPEKEKSIMQTLKEKFGGIRLI